MAVSGSTGLSATYDLFRRLPVMVSLADAAKDGPPPDPRLRCGVGDWIRSLDAAEQVAARQLLDDVEWNDSALARQFISAGMPLRMNALSVHRRGACSCLLLRKQ